MTKASVLTHIPENTSILQSTKFMFIFPTLPFLKYFAQTATLPAVSTSPVSIETPFARTYRHGDKLVYEDFTINAIVDEDLRVWQETYNWITSLTKPTKFEEYIRFYNESSDPYHDGILTVNTNANNPNMRFKFRSCHPVSIGAIQFNSTDNAQTIPTVDITFRYDYYELERL